MKSISRVFSSQITWCKYYEGLRHKPGIIFWEAVNVDRNVNQAHWVNAAPTNGETQQLVMELEKTMKRAEYI